MSALRQLVVLAAQALALAATAVGAAWSALYSLPVALATAGLRSVLPGALGASRSDGWARFYEVGAAGGGGGLGAAGSGARGRGEPGVEGAAGVPAADHPSAALPACRAP